MFENSDDILTVAETCKLLKIGRTAIYPLLASGQLHAFRNGRTWRIAKESVVQYVRQNGQQS